MARAAKYVKAAFISIKAVALLARRTVSPATNPRTAKLAAVNTI